MAEVEKYGSTKRFGVRYGRTLKERFGKIEKEQRKWHKCPYCNQLKVRRLSLGIWQCRKCGVKFTGKAYSTKEKISFEETKEKEKKETEESKNEDEMLDESKEESKTEEISEES